MNKHNPLVSVVIPCYNDAQFIEQTIDCVLNQTYKNIEIIVVDDGSNLEDKRVLKNIKPKITKLITQENLGQSAARNKGVHEAKGDYILVLDSDDYFESTFCKKAIKVFFNNKEVKLITSLVNRMVDDKIVDVFKPRGGKIEQFILNNQLTGSCVFMKSDFNAVNGYDEKMNKGFEDWEFYIRVLKAGGVAHIINEPLFFYRLRANSTTSKANRIKYDLLNYIYLKHKELYVSHFELFVNHLLRKIEREEKEKIKNTERLEYRIGNAILRPFRWVKSLFR
tara:strand:+ start:54587 stop:55426 length:840 start_codon:yes stop_codon:yes gene_type:complete